MPTVLILCTANRCRSPMAEYLLRACIEELDLDWSITSSGLHAYEGGLMHPFAVTALHHRGIQVDEAWTTRRLDSARLAASDLILTATHQHLSTLITSSPAVVRRSFVLGQFARLLDHVTDVPRARTPAELIRLAGQARALMQPRAQQFDDVRDPIGHKQQVFDACANELSAAMRVIARHLAPDEYLAADESGIEATGP